MQTVKKTADYQIFKKRSGRYCVQTKDQAWVKGDDKLQILVKEGFVKISAPKKKAEEPAAADNSTQAPSA
jgi:hypothetical protein